MKQSIQVVPVTNASPVLIANGFDEVARFHLSSDFVVNADEDGEVIDYDSKSEIMIVKYKSGNVRAVDLGSKIVKNGGGGYYLSNRLITKLSVGDKFKKDDIIAYHKDFFTNSKYNNCRLNVGTLAKVALMSTYNTYEDGTFITNKLAKDASTEMVFDKKVVVGKNSNIEYMVNKGDKVLVGDSLIQFDSSFDDDSINALLANMSEGNKEAILENSRNDVKSKISGVIEDIKIYATVELDEMSESLRNVCSKYYKAINHKNNFLNKYDPDSTHSVIKCGVFTTEVAAKVKPNQYGVIKGEEVDDGVLIEFYIKHSEPLEVGSKIANFSALKNTIDEIIPDGYEPWSEFRPEEEVSTIIASNSILNRMVPSIYVTTLGYKIVIELKRSLKDIWDNGSKEEVRQKMLSLIYKFFTAVDKTGNNTKHYKLMFDTMSGIEFNRFFTGFFEDDKAYLTLNIVDYEHNLTMEDIEKGAKVLNVPLYEYVSLPHITMDKSRVITTKQPVPVGYILIKRPQQTVLDTK